MEELQNNSRGVHFAEVTELVRVRWRSSAAVCGVIEFRMEGVFKVNTKYNFYILSAYHNLDSFITKFHCLFDLFGLCH